MASTARALSGLDLPGGCRPLLHSRPPARSQCPLCVLGWHVPCPGGLAEHMTPGCSWALHVRQCPLCVDGPLAQAGTGRTGPMLVGVGGDAQWVGRERPPALGSPRVLGGEGNVFLKSEEAPGQGSRWLVPGPPPWGRGGLAGGRPVPSAEGRKNSSGRASASEDVGAKRSGGQSVWGRGGVGPLTGQAGQGSDPGWPRGKVTSVGQAWAPRPLTLSHPSPYPGAAGYPAPHPTPGTPRPGVHPPCSPAQAQGPRAATNPGTRGPQMCPRAATPWPLAV